MRKRKSEDLGIKLGSDDMVYWRNIIDAQTLEIKGMEKSLRFSKWLVDNAQIEYEEAEQEFNSNA